MADVFISYKSERRPAARHLADVIEAHGFSVWFDYDLVPGKNFGRRIEEELRAAKAAIVLWCSISVTSEWVQDEADLAKKLGRFVPARMEPCEPPLGFRRDDFVDISTWDGDPRSALLDRLFDRLETLVGRPSAISRKRIVDLHTGWATMGRPTLAQFGLGASRDIAEVDRRMPSSETVASAEPIAPASTGASSAQVPTMSHDYAFWKSEWDAHKSGSDLVPLRAIADHAPPYFASQAQLRIGEIEATSPSPPRSSRGGEGHVGDIPPASGEGQVLGRSAGSVFKQAAAPLPNPLPVRTGRGDDVARWQTDGRIKIDAAIFHGDSDAAKAGWLKPGAGKTEWFKDLDIAPEMVVVPAGSFTIGSPESEPGRFSQEGPQTIVNIAQRFAVGRHAVTHGQFAAFVNTTGYKTEAGAYGWTGGEWILDPRYSWRSPSFAQDDSHPVVCVNWDDARAYVTWLSEQTGKPYRALSDSEWEYAARAGTTTPFWWGSAITPKQANYDGNHTYSGGGSKGEYRKATVPVGSFEANPWGLFNVHGNVWEWCEDVWHDSLNGIPTDGSPWLQGGDTSRRVVRGGSWNYDPGKLRAALRNGGSTVIRIGDQGFRVGRTL